MIIILSMHRSGSSLLTGLLHAHGYSAGNQESLIAADKHNAKGYYERHDVVDFNESLLRSDGFSSSFPDIRKRISLSDDENEELSKIAGALVEEHVSVLKDPRLCLTLPCWTPVLDDIRVVMLYRNPLDVAESFVRRQRYPFSAGLALWEFYNRQALKVAREFPISFVNFDELVANSDDVIGRVVNDLDLGRIASGSKRGLFEVDMSLVHGAMATRKYDRLTNSQKELYVSLQESKIPNNIEDLPETMGLAFELVENFVDQGFTPGTGKLLDKQSEQQMADIVSRNGDFREANTRLRGEITVGKKTITELKKDVLNSTQLVKSLERNASKLEQDLDQINNLVHHISSNPLVKLTYIIFKVIFRILPNSKLARAFKKLRGKWRQLFSNECRLN